MLPPSHGPLCVQPTVPVIGHREDCVHLSLEQNSRHKSSFWTVNHQGCVLHFIGERQRIASTSYTPLFSFLLSHPHFPYCLVFCSCQPGRQGDYCKCRAHDNKILKLEKWNLGTNASTGEHKTLLSGAVADINRPRGTSIFKSKLHETVLLKFSKGMI